MEYTQVYKGQLSWMTKLFEIGEKEQKYHIGKLIESVINLVDCIKNKHTTNLDSSLDYLSRHYNTNEILGALADSSLLQPTVDRVIQHCWLLLQDAEVKM